MLTITRALAVIFAAAVFYLVFTPIGVVVRLFGHDPLRRKFSSEARSYWRVRADAGSQRRRMTRQY